MSTKVPKLCPICRDVLDSDVTLLPDCSHEYHEECIMRWVKIGSNSCPLCKKSVAYIKRGKRKIKVTPKKQTCQSQIDDLTVMYSIIYFV